VKGLEPRARLLAGAGAFAACVLAPAASWTGSGVIAATALAWLAACGPPARRILAAVGLGCALFLPFFLLPLLAPRPAGPGDFAVPWGVCTHGFGCLLVSLGTVAALGVADFHDGLERLPLPRLVRAILGQIVHQSGHLAAETRRLTDALAVRGASGGGAAALRLVAALPTVWLPRLLQRAERLALAMELRGYDGAAPLRREGAVSAADVAVPLLSLAWAGVAAWLRWRGAA
jgi:energy-coupling factor transporter transmembrane protein EcfT